MAVTVFICSPFRAIGGNTIEENTDLVKRLCRAAALAGYAPWAPHLFCTQFLNDALESERNCGLEIGRTMLSKCKEMWVYDQLGVSSGMQGDIVAATCLGMPIHYNHSVIRDVSAKRIELIASVR